MLFGLIRLPDPQIDELLKDSSPLEQLIYPGDLPDDMESIDLDKSWNGLLYLLTGKGLDELDHPMTAIFFSGQLVDPEQDLGYGPAHYVRMPHVQDLSQQLQQLTLADVGQRFDGKKMEALNIYPGKWDDGQDSLDYLLEYFEELKNFYARAALAEQAIISFVY
ncbi:MAG: YfbM family protein [Bacteroidota bacterium]